MERRLAAILCADVVGYSRMMGADEVGTLFALKAHRAEFIDPEIARHRGRIVKLMGDGALIEFASVVDALECAVAIQQGMRERNAGVAANRRVAFRIGINIGDVIVEGEDIYGNGVNIAARLEALAEPGAICVSGNVFNAVEGKLHVDFEDLGLLTLKNIDKPVQAYRVGDGETDEPEAPPEGTDPETPASKKPAIAVLPFTNMSGDPEQEYFSDGLTEDIITALSYWRSFPVIARNSTFFFKGQSVVVQRVGHELGARYVLEGSVRRVGNRLRVNAQLVDAETGHSLWVERLDRPMEDVFAVQDEIARKIAFAIEPELEQAEIARSASRRPNSLTAWDLFLRGMAHMYKVRHDDYLTARTLFERAVQLEPDYGEAWAGLGWSYLRELEFSDPDGRGDMLEKGMEAAKRAVALDGKSAFAHVTLGTAFVWVEQFDRGIAEVERALELNPYYAHAHMALGNRLDLVGRTAEGIEKMEVSLDLNPRDPSRAMYMSFLSRAYISQGDHERALDWVRHAVEQSPDNPDFQYRLAICLALCDRADEARAALTECERLEPGYPARRANWRPYREPERNEAFFAGLVRHGLMPTTTGA